MVQINWTLQALSDLKDLADYISKDEKHYAKLQVIRLKSSVEILKNQIEIGRIVPEFDRENLRQIIEGNYRIVYKIVNKDRVDILTIHHSSRDLKSRKIL